MFRRFTISLADAIPATPPAAQRGTDAYKSFSRSLLRSLSIREDEIADLLSEGSSTNGVVKSPWKDGDFPTDSILFPSELIQTHRSLGIPKTNYDRLTYLWSLSNSHGVSWDELDDAFLSFHRKYLKSDAEWAQNYEDRFQKEYVASSGILKKASPGDEALVSLMMSRRRGKIRRMTYKRLSRMRLKEVIRPFQLSAFKDYMRDFMAQRVSKREQSERDLE